MNISSSEFSSGCESGWTMYLDQISDSTDPYKRRGFVQVKEGAQYVNQDDREDDDEDLSMMSDASSGPPHKDAVSEDRKKSKRIEAGMKKKKKNLCLDDTATSPNYHFSQGNVGASEKHNFLCFEGESVKKKHLSLFKSSTKGKSGSLLGRKRQ